MPRCSLSLSGPRELPASGAGSGRPRVEAGGRRVSDAELEVQPPAMAQGKLGLLMQTLGIGRGAVLVALGMLTTTARGRLGDTTVVA